MTVDTDSVQIELHNCISFNI